MDTYDRATGEVTSGTRFATQWDRPTRDESEKPSQVTQTEMAYVPPEARIKDMMDAGARLAAYRRARFDSLELRDDGEDLALDPARNPGADIVDVTRAGLAAQERLKAAEKEAKDARKAAAEAAAEAAKQAPAGTAG